MQIVMQGSVNYFAFFDSDQELAAVIRPSNHWIKLPHTEYEQDLCDYYVSHERRKHRLSMMRVSRE